MAASESVASTSAATALARTPTKTKKTSNARLQIGRHISTLTQRTKPTAKPSQRQAVSPSLLRRPHLVISRLRKHPNRKKKKTKSKSKKSDASDTDSYRRKVEERRKKAIEDMAKSFSDPVAKSPVMPTSTPAAVIVEELDDDKLWGKLLVRRIKQIKDEDMR